MNQTIVVCLLALSLLVGCNAHCIEAEVNCNTHGTTVAANSTAATHTTDATDPSIAADPTGIIR